MSEKEEETSKYFLSVSNFGSAWNFSKGRNSIRSYDSDVLLVDWRNSPDIWIIYRGEEIEGLHLDFPDQPPAQGAVYCRGMKSTSDQILCLESLESMAFNEEQSGLLVADCFNKDFALLLLDFSRLLKSIKKEDWDKWKQNILIDNLLRNYYDSNLKIKAVFNYKEPQAEELDFNLIQFLGKNIEKIIISNYYLTANAEKIKEFRSKPKLVESDEIPVTAARKLLINLIHRVGNTRYPVFGETNEI